MTERDPAACAFYCGDPKRVCDRCSLSWVAHFGEHRARPKAPAPPRKRIRQNECGGVRVNRRTPDRRPVSAYFGERDG